MGSHEPGLPADRRRPGALEAGRALARVVEEVEGDVVGDWHRDTEPGLPPAWQEVAGRSSTRVLVTREELVALETAWEELLAPYVHRKTDPSSAPDDARLVHVLRHVMPERDG